MKIRIFFIVSALLMVCSLTAQPPTTAAFHSTSVYVSAATSAQQPMTQTAELMSTGSCYASRPYDVGKQEVNALYETTYSNASDPKSRAKRNAPPTDDDYDPDNPNWGPISDANWFLIVLASAFILYKLVRTRKNHNSPKCPQNG